MVTRWLICRRDAAGDRWVHEVARIPIRHDDPAQEARARRAERRLAAWDRLLTTWNHLTRPTR